MGVHPRLQNSLLLPLALATIAASGFGQSYDLAADFSPVINDYAGVWSYYQPSWSTGASSGELLSNSGLIAIGSSEGLGMSNG